MALEGDIRVRRLIAKLPELSELSIPDLFESILPTVLGFLGLFLVYFSPPGRFRFCSLALCPLFSSDVALPPSCSRFRAFLEPFEIFKSFVRIQFAGVFPLLALTREASRELPLHFLLATRTGVLTMFSFAGPTRPPGRRHFRATP
jgi:hypothetical protein